MCHECRKEVTVCYGAGATVLAVIECVTRCDGDGGTARAPLEELQLHF